ncbi:MAG: reverse transcriptase domain-containing protein [Marinifilaceae bacterium]
MNPAQIYKNVAQKLFEIFYVDDHKYGRQHTSGAYHLVREKITPVTIEDMLINQKSLLTYQELHTLDIAYIKWICIDLDISKQEIDANKVNDDNLKLVKKSADDICKFLDTIELPYLLEFSGRRGFHIWIVFEELITKSEGYHLVTYILSKVQLQRNIIADKFPTIPDVSKYSKGVGKGVKLPLSQNKSSGTLSYFIGKKDVFDYNKENWLTSPNSEFLEKQYEILCNLQTISKEKIQPYLEEQINTYNEVIKERFLKSKKRVSSFLSADTSLDDILGSLNKCTHVRELMKDYQKGLGNKERAILAGLLGKLKTQDDPSFGYKIILELFSHIKGFNAEITKKKLENIKYYSPITCSYWGKCGECGIKNIISPIQLIEGVKLENIPSFQIENINSNLFSKIKKAQIKYSQINDEVPLYPQTQKLVHIDQTTISKRINEIFNGNFGLSKEFYVFKRNEDKKVRVLYNLDYTNNFISTYFLFILNNLFYSEISNYSYGYQIAPSFYNDNLFTNWFINWGTFSKNIEHIIYNEEYNDYYLVKIDIKGFYDQIDHQRLSIKLLEESPDKIKAKIKELDNEDFTKYKNIIEFLIELTKSVKNNSSKGVPQGPAYARYLAELYLLGLDKTIENYIGINKGRETYNRFVDDIYIFLESEDRAIELNNKIVKWLNINNLEVNNQKSEISNVEEYRNLEKFKKYQDDVKYTINRANKDKYILTDKEIRKILIKLEKLTSDVKFGLKDNLRFFYYQFKDDTRLGFIRQRLAQILPFSNDGRGTLYMMFYEDLINRAPEDFFALSNSLERINGLSLTHYLNTILTEWKKTKENKINHTLLIEKVTRKNELSDADKLLILTILMKQDITASDEFYDKCTQTIKNAALEIPGLRYTIKHYQIIKGKLSELYDSELFIKELFRIINNHELDLEVARGLANYSFTRFSEWSDNDLKNSFLDNIEFLILYYHCLCFFTLFETSQNHHNVSESWLTLLQKSERYMIKEKIEFHWLKKLNSFTSKDFSKNSYSLLLGATNGSQFNKFNCRNGFVKKYRDILLFLLFSLKDNLNGFISNTQDYKPDSLLYDWLINRNVKLHPNSHDICMQNLALNGLIVLENNSAKKLFIKSLGNKLDEKKFEYLNCSIQDNNEFEYSIDEFISVNNILDQSDLVSFLITLNQLIVIHQKFKEVNKVGYPVFYNPIRFKKGDPLVPFYSIFNELILSDGNNLGNSIDSYWNNILDIINSTRYKNVKITIEENKFNYSINELEKEFFPSSEIIGTRSVDKISFLQQFVKTVDEHEIKSIFDFQYFWTLTILNILENDRNSIKDLLMKFFNIHFRHYESDQGSLKDILFTVNENTAICDKNLEDFIKTIKRSIISFQSELTKIKHAISSKIDDYCASEMESFVKSNMFDGIPSFNDFELCKIQFQQKYNYETEKKEDFLTINGSFINLENAFYFCHKTDQFLNVTNEISLLLNDREYVYLYESNDKYYIYKPEDELIKAYERVKERKLIHEDIIKGTVSARLKDLFPPNEYYNIASDFYDNVDTVHLEDLLDHHYTSASKIKDRIINWLSLFNANSIKGSKLEAFMVAKENSYSIVKLYEAIIESLTYHVAVTDEDINYFSRKIVEYNSSDDYLFFPLKHPYRDRNGLERLFDKCKFKERAINVDIDVNRLLSESCQGKSIIILADISISGSQAKKALKFYLGKYKDNQTLEKCIKRLEDKNEKYFHVKSIEQLIQLKNNFIKAKQVIFISPLITESFIKNIKAKFNELQISTSINFEYNTLLKENEYLLGEKRMDINNKDLLYMLMQDSDLLSNIFNFEDRELYDLNNKFPGKRNVLLRVGSLPSKHILLFSLKPKNGSEALLDYIENWSK